MSSVKERQARLKQTVIEYLRTCDGKKCPLADFWNNVSHFQKKNVNHKYYGVSKMRNLLDKFNDVLVSCENFVCLRPEKCDDQNSQVIVVESDSDEESSWAEMSSLTFSSMAGKDVPSDRDKKLVLNEDFQEQMISILLAKNGRCHVSQFIDNYQAAYGQLPLTWMNHLLANSDFVQFNNQELILQQKAYKHREERQKSETQRGTNSAMSRPPVWGSGIMSAGADNPSVQEGRNMNQQNASLPGVPGFIPFSSGESRTLPQAVGGSYTNQPPQLPYQRYGLNALGSSTVSFAGQPHPGRGMPLMGASPVPNQLRPGMFYPSVQSTVQDLLNSNNMLIQPASAAAFASPALVNSQAAAQSLLGNPLISAPYSAVPAPALSEWPRSEIKSGMQPGTKITDNAKEITVRPVSLPKGTRLTSEQVNYEVTQCIDALSEAKEHVSIERVESLLLKKFQVTHFRLLNLRESFFDHLPAAREHNMKLGKVNTYIQSFVRSRSMCTLYELKGCLREFHPEGDDFEHLKLGPLQKMPLVHDMFKFPMDEHIPELTSTDIFERLNNYLNITQKWKQQVSLEEFMKYLVEYYHVSNGFSLGIRIRSIPLAIQMLKKSQRDAASARKKSCEELKQILNADLLEAFVKFRANILQTSQDGSLELRRHYMNLSPEDAVKDIITKFELLAHILMSNSAHSGKIEKMMKHFDHFLKSVLEVPIPRMLYHLSVCLSDLQVQESAQEFLEQEARQQEQQAAAQQEIKSAQQEKMPPTRVELTEKVVQYLNRCLEHGSLQLSHLGRIESKVLEDFNFSSFKDMGYGRFLEFVLAETKIKLILEECGGTVLGPTSGSHETESIFKPSQLELLEFICQCKHTGVAQNQQIEYAICEQFHVTDLRHLGHGNISRLCGAADRHGKHVCKEYHVNFEAALCGKNCPTTRNTSKVGIQGVQTKETAVACLTACPLLEDMMEWSHWSLVFQPQLGCLRDFIEKYGGLNEIFLEGGHKKVISDFMALEVEPGKLLKISSQTTQEQFCAALECEDSVRSAGCLVSLIVANRGIENTPLALLANSVKTKLIALHARSPGFSIPGGPPGFESHHTVDLAVQFVTDIMLQLPIRICVAVANQVLLEPLSSVVGSAKSKKEVTRACKLPVQKQRLELLGCFLGLPEWTSSLQSKFEFPSSHMIEVMEHEVLDQTELDDQEEEESGSEEESRSCDSDIDSILSNIEENSHSLEGKIIEESQEGDEKYKEDEDDGKEENEDGDKNMVEESQETETESSEVSRTSESLEESNKMAIGCVEDDGEKELTREEICQLIVNTIQREEFGVGIQLDETGEKLMQKQQERQGRSLQRLSKDLYSKETHFVLELIQNADDNSYDSDTVPAVKFLIDFSGVSVMNNELGFEEKNIRALCDVGKSTKEKHMFGYIGQKGIGFKSVFRVSGRPEVHSNGFHICFDVDSGPMGYILPHWISKCQADEEWQTRIVLPWTEDIKQHVQTHAARFNDIQPSLLLFLHRLKKITIENKVEGSVMSMERIDVSEKEILISHTYGKDRWLVLRKILDASGVSVQMKSGAEVESTEIALAFPLHDKSSSLKMKLKKLPVFAFLPLRSYGFRFIVQGDFDVPSSREDVDKDSSWNQWLRNEIHILFVEALDVFKTQPDLSPIKALIVYLQFIPLEGEVMDFFKPVVTKVLALLRARECMPVLTEDKKSIQWKMPSKTVITKDSLVMEIISPELLQRVLGLHYLHPDVACILDEPLIQALGVVSVTTDHLLHIGQSISVNWNDGGNTEQVTELAKWLACVYRSLDDFQENRQTIEKLCSLRIIPLSDGSLVSMSDVTVFLLNDGRSDADSVTKKKQKTAQEPLLELRKDLNLVHTDLTNTGDNEVNSQVVKLLVKMGIKQMNAHDLIHSHIMPILKSEQWKDKKRDVIISYLVYIKIEKDRNPSVVDMTELRSAARLATNHGIKLAEVDDVHFSPAFGNKINLRQILPGIEWTLVDSAYLSQSPSQVEVQSWHNFLSELGVVDFLRVKKIELHFDKTNIHETSWAACREVWPDSPDGYTVVDFQCEEFHKLVTASQNTQQQYDHMTKLYELLDMEWNGKYSHFVNTQLRSGSGHVLREVIQSSFSIHLTTFQWVPSIWTSVTVQEDSKTVTVSVIKDLRTPSELHSQDNIIKSFLGHTVKYINVLPQRNSSFTQFLKIKTSVSVSELKERLILWCKRDETSPETPKTFCTTRRHVLELYEHLCDNLTNKEGQDLFHNYPVIFVPVLNHDQIKEEDILVGKMLKREEVWWSDHTQLFTKYRDSLEVYKSPLAKRKFLQHIYQSLEEKFQRCARVDKEPSTYHLAQLLKHIATVNSASDTDTLTDTLFLFSKIGADLYKINDCAAGVKTHRAMIAESNLPKVVDLLTKAAVFPTKQGQWVSLTDQPMIVDSLELEEMFQAKPSVYFLQLEVKELKKPRDRDSKGAKIDQDCLKYCMSLFPSIKPLSECVRTEEITSHFQQCSKGQKFLHDVVGLLQRFLYFIFPEVHKLIKDKKANTLKELLFCQVRSLEVKYELNDRPHVFEIREEKCVVKDKHFYFHEQYINSQTDINREVAKYFSENNEDCVRELRSFLTQVVPILEGRSDETIEMFLSRQKKPVGNLPPDEEAWEIPPPIIEAPEPAVTAGQVETMVYSRALSVPGTVAADTDTTAEENTGMKSWPPKSSLHGEQSGKSKKSATTGSGQAGVWPPTQGPSYSNTSKLLPSSIKFEESEQENTGGSSIDEDKRPFESEAKDNLLLQQSSPASSSKVMRPTSDCEGKHVCRQLSFHAGGDQRLASGRAEDRDQAKHASDNCTCHRQSSEVERRASLQASGGGRREDKTVIAEDSDGDTPNTGEKRKRKLTDSSREEDSVLTKRRNSQEDKQKQVMQDEVREAAAMAGEQDTVMLLENEDAEKGAHTVTADRHIYESHSSREVTPTSSDTNLDIRRQNKKGILQFTIPMWSEGFEDIAYTELSKGHDLTIPSILLNNESPPAEIGLWGEKLVWDYLQQQKQFKNQITQIFWANADGEKGFPYDFEISYVSENQKIYIEVKSTVSWDKEVFPVSSKQIEFALQHRGHYEIYRVFGAGNSNPKLVRVENVAERMKSKSVRLFMVL